MVIKARSSPCDGKNSCPIPADLVRIEEKLGIRLVAGYLLREEVMFRLIWVTLAAVALSLYFVPTSTFAQGQGKRKRDLPPHR